MFSQFIEQQNFLDDTISLKNVVITESKKQSKKVENWSKQEITAKNNFLTIDELIQNNSNIFIKSYGIGSLATLSVRGGNAGHSTILWNDLPIINPMLGLVDLQLIQQNLFDNLNVTKGLNTTTFGSGAINAVLNLENESSFQNQFSLNINSAITSYKGLSEQVKLNFGNEKFQSETNFNYNKAENNFPFYDEGEKYFTSNAKVEQINFLQNLYYQNKNVVYKLRYWHQNSERQNPPHINQKKSVAYRIDKANRIVIETDWQKSNSNLNFKTAFYDEDLNYYDDAIILKSLSNVKTFIVDLVGENYHNKNNIKYSFNNIYRKVNFTYDDAENQFSAFANYTINHKKFQHQLSLRQIFVDKKAQPLIPQIESHLKINNEFSLYANVGRLLKLPTFNDRFYLLGGKRNLKAENGWSEEVSINIDKFWKYFKLNFKSTLFNNNFNDYILWAFQEGENFPSVNNIEKVWSRGFEQNISCTSEIKATKIGVDLNYQFVKSTFQIESEKPKINFGNQLWYVPKHFTTLNFNLAKQNFKFNYNYQIIGKTNGINADLDGYNLSNIALSYNTYKLKYPINFYLNLNNVFSKSYFVIENRPMPLFNFLFGVNLNIT